MSTNPEHKGTGMLGSFSAPSESFLVSKTGQSVDCGNATKVLSTEFTFAN